MLRQGVLRQLVVLAMVASGVLGQSVAGTQPAASAVPAARPPDRAVTLLSSGEAGVTFDVAVPWRELRAPVSGAGYTAVSLPGWPTTTQEGAPALPQMAQTIGVPFGVDLSVRVTAGPAHTLALAGAPQPVPSRQIREALPAVLTLAPPLPQQSYTLQEDAAIYSGAVPYPDVLARLAGDAVVRQQRTVGVVVYPVQYRPQRKELVVYEWLRVEVLFAARPGLTPATAPARAESAAYETLLQQELLNYDAARSWRSAAAPTLHDTPQAFSRGDVMAQVEQPAGVGPAAIPWAPPNPGWRIKVQADGFYQLTHDDLNAAGLPVNSLDPRTFRLYNQGVEVAIHVVGQADGSFDKNNGDNIVFYGQAPSSKYTADNVYWLTYGGSTGLRMAVRSGAPGVALPPPEGYHAEKRHLEGNAYYLPKATGSEALERWFWDYVYPPSKPTWVYTFTVPAPYVGAYQAALTLTMMGYVQSPINPDHHVKVRLNGTDLADVKWDGNTWYTLQTPVTQTLLQAGNNTLSIFDPNDTGVGYDIVYVDWADLQFANTFRAQNNVLPFTYGTAGTWKFQVEGFSSNTLAVYDVTNPAAVARITGIQTPAVGGGYAALFQDAVSAPTRYWATATSAYGAVAAGKIKIEQDTASNLQATTNGADYIVITHKDFWTQAVRLRDDRATKSLRTIAVDVQDVYDEFGYGLAGAPAIYAFLAYTYANWTAPAPSYVALLGDGHYDPKNFTGIGRTSHLPPYLAPVDPWLGETAADNRYVTLVGSDTMPDMMLGRLAVSTLAQATAFVDKILAYENSPLPGDWKLQVLVVADNRDEAGNFDEMSDTLIACCIPAPYQAEKVYLGAPHTYSQARTEIITATNAGKFIVNYTGHGAPTQWADEALWMSSDAAGMTNGQKLPVMLPMTCYDGFYHYPFLTADGFDSTAEVVTRVAGKGAVASWSPTGLGVATGHVYLDRGFMQALFSDADGRITLGQATSAGKQTLLATGANFDLLDTYLLFGDPATMLGITRPTAVDLLSFTGSVVKGRVNLQWQTASEINNAGFNLYRASSAEGVRTRVNEALIPSRVYPGSPAGAAYRYTERTIRRGSTYYWLEDVDTSGVTSLHGPIMVKVGK